MDQRSPVTKIFKVVGYATALLTLAFGVSRVWIGAVDYRSRQNSAEELLATADIQLIGPDYSGAWSTVGEAADLVPSDRIRRRLEDVAMAWLRDMRVPEGATFTDAVAPLIQVVTRGVTLSEGERRADLLAHVGWANFLRSREGFDSDFDRYYDEALAIDPDNPFANAFRGHWILWLRGSPDDADPYFDAGTGSGREREFVRRLQMAALANAGSIENSVALVRMAVEVHSGGEALPEAFVPTVWRAAYQLVLANRNDRQREAVLGAAPPEDHLAMFEAFFDTASAAYRESRWERDLWLAHILDRAGEPERAAALLADTPRTSASGSSLNDAYIGMIDDAITRFSAATR